MDMMRREHRRLDCPASPVIGGEHFSAEQRRELPRIGGDTGICDNGQFKWQNEDKTIQNNTKHICACTYVYLYIYKTHVYIIQYIIYVICHYISLYIIYIPSDSKARICYSRSVFGGYTNFSYHLLSWFPGKIVHFMNLCSRTNPEHTGVLLEQRS